MQINLKCVYNGVVGFILTGSIVFALGVLWACIYHHGYLIGKAETVCLYKLADKGMCHLEGYKYGDGN